MSDLKIISFYALKSWQWRLLGRSFAQYMKKLLFLSWTSNLDVPKIFHVQIIHSRNRGRLQVQPLARNVDFRWARADGDFEEFLMYSGRKCEPLVGTYSAEGYSMVETTRELSAGISTLGTGAGA